MLTVTQIKVTSKLEVTKTYLIGGPDSIFVKYFSADKPIDDLKPLYLRLVDLGIECLNGKVCLADLSKKMRVVYLNSIALIK